MKNAVGRKGSCAERETAQNKRECYNKTFSLGWGGVTRRGTSRRVFLVVFRAVLLAKRETERNGGRVFKAHARRRIFCAATFLKITTGGTKKFCYICVYYDTHICSMFHVPFSHSMCRRMVMLLTFISFFSIKKKNNNFCDFFVVLIFVFNI